MQTTVLFADLSGSSKLHELAGEAVALEIIARCMERLRQAAEAGGGEVVKTSGDQVMALFPTPDAAARAAREAKPGGAAEVRLTYHGEVIACSAQNETVVIGRHRGCGLVVADRMASRRHCTIELRGEEYVLQDHSMNGTYVTVAGEKGIFPRGDDLPLAHEGSTAFGPQHLRRR